MTLAGVTVAVALASGCADAVSAHPSAAAKKPAPATASFSAMAWRSGIQ
jgi:AhpD family alkylhydroperoxidase